MSESPLLTKMDALLKKHRGGEPAAPAPPPGTWLPVLTDVIERGTPPAPQAVHARSTDAAADPSADGGTAGDGAETDASG